MTRQHEGVVLPFSEASPLVLSRLAQCGAFPVLYLGSSFVEFTALSRLLPDGWTLLSTGKCLNAAADAMRGAIIDLDAAVLKPDAPRTWWDATHIGERNPLASTLMLNLARFAALREALERHDRCLVLSDDRALCRLLHAEIQRLGHRAGWAVPGRRLPLGEKLRAGGWVLRCVVRGFRVRLRGLIEFVRRRSTLRRLRRRYPLPLAQLAVSDVLFVSWARVTGFAPGAALPDDPYLPHLADALAAAGLRVAYVMRALPGVPNYNALACGAFACPTPVLLLEELVSAGEMFAAAIASLFLPIWLPHTTVAGQEVTALLRHEAWSELGSWDCISAYTYRAACRRIAALGVKARVLVHPFEHQPWEKLLYAGVRRWLPGCRLVGVQHSPFAWNYLSLFPSRREIESGLIPDQLLVSGEGYAAWFQQAGFPADRLVVIGAPRHERLQSNTRADGTEILCCTGIELAESIELAAKAILASHALGHSLVINYHPVTDGVFRRALQETVERIVGGKPAHVRYVDAPASTLLGSAGVVLYSNSAAAFDALLADKSVIYVGRDVDLDLDKVPDGLSVQCTSIEDLQEALRGTLASMKRNQGEVALSKWLTPFNTALFTALLASRMSADCAA